MPSLKIPKKVVKVKVDVVGNYEYKPKAPSRSHFGTLWHEPTKKMFGDKRIKYINVGPMEVCPDTGRNHWHFYLRTFEPCRFVFLAREILKLNIGNDVWGVFVKNLDADGDPSTWDETKMINYCNKEGKPFLQKGERQGTHHKENLVEQMTEKEKKIFWDEIHAEMAATDESSFDDHYWEWAHDPEPEVYYKASWAL